MRSVFEDTASGNGSSGGSTPPPATNQIKTNTMKNLIIKDGKAYQAIYSNEDAYVMWRMGYTPCNKDLVAIETGDDLDTTMRDEGWVHMLISDEIESYDLCRELISRGFLSDVFHVDQVKEYGLSHSGAVQLMYDALISERVQSAVANEVERLATTSKRYKSNF